MSLGIWSGSKGSESLRQGGLERHRILTVNTGQDLATTWGVAAASGLASLDPNTIAAGTVNTASPRGFEGGPHFVMSPETPDGSPHSYGFEFVLFLYGLSGADQALPGAGGYTVTVWELISNTSSPDGAFIPLWAAFEPHTGVGLNEAWHSFDCNATALRFQITNLALDPVTNNRQIGIAFAEL